HEGDPEEGKRVAPARDPAGHLVLASGPRLRGAQRRRRVERRHQLQPARGDATPAGARPEAERGLEPAPAHPPPPPGPRRDAARATSSGRGAEDTRAARPTSTAVTPTRRIAPDLNGP